MPHTSLPCWDKDQEFTQVCGIIHALHHQNTVKIQISFFIKAVRQIYYFLSFYAWSHDYISKNVNVNVQAPGQIATLIVLFILFIVLRNRNVMSWTANEKLYTFLKIEIEQKCADNSYILFAHNSQPVLKCLHGWYLS